MLAGFVLDWVCGLEGCLGEMMGCDGLHWANVEGMVFRG